MQARRRFQVDQAVRMTGLPIPQGDLRNHLQIEALAEHHSTRGPMPCPRSQASGDAGLATIRLGSCGNVAVRIGGLCRGRSVIDRGGGTSSGIPTVVPTEPTETKSIELPTTEAVVLPTPEAGALTTSEAGVQSLPKTGFRGCTSGRYVRKHNPWVNFAKLPASTNRPFSAFPRDFCKLPTVSFLSPNVSRHTRLLGPAAATVG
jgi:hypothetical protein